MHDSARSAFTRVAAVAGAVHEAMRRRSTVLGRLSGEAIRGVVCGYARLELPRCVGLVEASIQKIPTAWPREGVRECRGVWHGYRLRLDLSDYFQCCGYFLRRYHDGPLQWLIERAVHRGDTVLDAGSNNGLVAMYAAWRVGAGGLVHAFEPNPRMIEQIRWHVTTNGLSQVRVHECGLSDGEDEMELRIPGQDNYGAGTFAPVPQRYWGAVRETLRARVVRADDLGLEVRGALVVKLDVEGFEMRALEGMRGLIERHRPLVISEVNEEMLAQAGSSGRELVGWMTGRGYRAYSFITRRAVVRQRKLVLTEVHAGAERYPLDVVFVHPQTVFWGRLGPFESGGG